MFLKLKNSGAKSRLLGEAFLLLDIHMIILYYIYIKTDR
jgi:hypothetical protein